jgi:hypothetical protein
VKIEEIKSICEKAIEDSDEFFPAKVSLSMPSRKVFRQRRRFVGSFGPLGMVIQELDEREIVLFDAKELLDFINSLGEE